MPQSPAPDSRAARAPRRPTVLQVLPALETGGVERGAVDVALALAAAGWRPLVASRGGRMVAELEQAGVRHLTLPLHLKDPFSHVVTRVRLRRLIQRERVDLVHARSRAPAWTALAAAAAARVPFITTFHGTYNFRGEWKRTYNSVMTQGMRVIAISDFIRDHILANYDCDPAVIRVIPRGVDFGRFDPTELAPERVQALARLWGVDDSRPVVLLPGRLTRWKGQTVLIEAAARLGRRDLHVILAGDDQGRRRYRRELEARIAAAGLSGIVRLVGEVADMPAAYALADVVVSASTEPEAFGRVAAEAAAMGKPVVATDHGGSRETVIHNLTGWLTPPGDPDALAAGVAQALALEPSLRRHLAARAIAHARENFAKDRMCAATLDVYREALEAYPRG